ncbi:acyl-CoA carboxylase subunit epsilon [Mycolicibacterium novocastrense]|uniref:Acyl-CoA carboxylase subunit epsilon n=1 Tax=Mycolicibacterium novocastrense TaxID=59813 RepID=A0AAW5SI14_MYCNV|nr:acyl-CoA carboxylase subunit epsilon [Mycolicibacterium novocastrense]
MSGANNPTPVSGDSANTSDVEADVTDSGAQQDHEAHIQVVRGEPSTDELAALIAVLAAASSAPSEPREQEENLWGHPVDRLRYTPFSWQRVTLVERAHMRRR